MAIATTANLSAFVQDQIEFSKRATLTLGVKLEENPFTGVEVQPNIRMCYALSEETTLWGAISRAIQTPSEASRSVQILYAVVPDQGSGFDTSIVLVPCDSADVESLVAFEAGERTRLGPKGSIDFTTVGFEVASSYELSKNVAIRGNYPFNHVSARYGGADSVVPWEFDTATPCHLAYFGLSWDIAEDWEFDTNLYYVGNQVREDDQIDASIRADLRLGWRAAEKRLCSAFIAPWLAVLCLLCSVAAAASTTEVDEYEVKAAFLFNFARYTSWPKGTFSSKTEPLVIAVVGKDPFGKRLEAVLSKREVGERKIVVRRSAKASDIKAAHIAVLGDMDAKELKAAQKKLKKISALVVADKIGTATSGTSIGFYKTDSKIRFEVHAKNLKASKIRLGSQLLKLAKIVGRK